MVGRLIQVANSAYQYPLVFKQLWHTPLVQSPDQEIAIEMASGCRAGVG
jgi:fatty-acyl-CoA synthase